MWMLVPLPLEAYVHFPGSFFASPITSCTVRAGTEGCTTRTLIGLAKKDPGKWTYASSGNGTSIHMSGAMFTQLTGTDMLHIPYKGSGPAVTDLLAGQDRKSVV